MSNRDMQLNVLVRLRDQMGGGLNKLTSQINKLGNTARKIGMVGTAVAAISFMGPLNEAAAFQQQLIDIAGTAELTGSAAFKFVEDAKTKYETMALEIGQTSETIAAGAGRMIAAGVDVDQVSASIRDIGVAATAANADFNDMAGVAQSLMLNLKLPADQVRDSLGALVVAGKMGSFELKDMAKEFPNLTSQVAKFGVTGREAVNFLGSGLQIAMKGASDTSVAANNFSNFLAKALAPRTVKNFEKMGVDIQAVMQDAATKGINPLEAVLSKVQKLTGVSQTQIDGMMKKAKENGLEGADALGYVRQQLEKIGAAGKISELFNDQQVLDFLVPMMANIDEFKSIKEQVAKATGAMTDKDFETQMQGINRQKQILSEIGTQFSREWGMAFGEWLQPVNNILGGLLKQFRAWDAATGGMLKKALSFGAGLTLLAVGIGALGMALPIITAGFGAIGAVIGLVLSPLGIIIGLLAGVGVMIWQNWDKVAPKLQAFWNGLKETAGKAWTGIKGAWSKMSPYMSKLWSHMSRDAGRAFTWVSDKASRAWNAISGGFSNAFSGINWDATGANILAAYDTAINGLAATFKFLGEVWDGFAPSLAAIGENLKGAFDGLSGTYQNIQGISDGLLSLVGALAKLMGFGDGSGKGVAKFLGEVLGGLGQLTSLGLDVVANVLQIITGALRSMIDILNGQVPDWKNYFPDWLVGFVEKLNGGIATLQQGLSWFNGGDGMKPLPAGALTTPTQNGALTAHFNQMSPEQKAMLTPEMRRNAEMASFNPRAMAPVQPLPQKVQTAVDVKVKVDGPGTATTTATTTGGDTTTSDGGMAVGRP